MIFLIREGLNIHLNSQKNDSFSFIFLGSCLLLIEKLVSMKIFLFFSFFLTGGIVFATTSKPLSLEVNTGYRQDHLKWSISQDPATTIYRETYKKLQFWQSEFTLRKIHRDLFFQALGTYATIGQGGLQQHTRTPEFLTTNDFFFSTKGQAFQVQGSFGYLVNLTPDRYYKVFVLPLVGYLYDYENIKRYSPTPNPYLPDEFSAVESDLSEKNLTLKWNGPFLGVEFWIEPLSLWQFQVGYSFHFLHQDLSTWIIQNEQIYSQNSILVVQSTLKDKVNIDNGGNIAHFGKVKASVQFKRGWYLNFEGKIHYFSGQVHPFTLEKTVQTTFPVESEVTNEPEAQQKLRSTVLIFLIGITREF